ncbi:MAG: hypothetical protein IAF38_13415 [Bacteroidia bacterium]|nr:hypothetical protein [Bacteroidia bacterium]
MQIIYPLLFQEEVLEAKLVEKQSAFSYDEKEWVLEVNANGVPVQVQPPAGECILVAATPEEKNALESAGYNLVDKT